MLLPTCCFYSLQSAARNDDSMQDNGRSRGALIGEIYSKRLKKGRPMVPTPEPSDGAWNCSRGVRLATCRVSVTCTSVWCNLSSQFPEVALLATASKRIVLPLVLPALAQSLPPATEAADPPPQKGSSQRLPQLPPLISGQGRIKEGPARYAAQKSDSQWRYCGPHLPSYSLSAKPPAWCALCYSLRASRGANLHVDENERLY